MKGTRTYQILIVVLILAIVGCLKFTGVNLSDVLEISDKTGEIAQSAAQAYVAILAAWKVFNPHPMKHE